jgi:putative membrane protein insertion efficiency factor
MKFIFDLPKNAAIFLIWVYQKTLSPDHSFWRHLFPGGYCKYTPTCSVYASESFKKYGFTKGFIKSAKRILSCNPCSKGGLDLP